MLLLLLLAVLVPTAGLLYFISEGISNQRDLARRSLGEAYRGQLRLVRERIDSFWEERARSLDSRTESDSPSLFFEHSVRDGLADSVIVLNRDGSPAYPSLPAAPRLDPTLRGPAWMEARSLESAGNLVLAAGKYAAIAGNEKDPSIAVLAEQASIRCQVRSGQKEAAVRAIEDWFKLQGLAYATSPDGRMIAADEALLELQLLNGSDPRLTPAADHLHHLLQNYQHPMPSAQRLFLMNQMRALSLDRQYRTFITYQAERLAERVLSAGKAVPGDAALRLSGVADTWMMTSPGGRVIALYYQADRLVSSMAGFLEPRNSSRDPVFALTRPGGHLPPHDDWMEAGPRLPGWQISMATPNAAPATGMTGRRVASYLWLGFLTIATMAVLAVLAGRLFSRQMRIANLKTDLVAAVSHELKTPLASMKLLVEALLSGEELDPVRTRKYLDLVARENTRLSRLIDNFLTFSRMERNRGKFDFAKVQPEAVVRAAVESIGERFHVDVTMDGHLPPLYADEDALVTVLLNLLDNAFKYTGDDRRIALSVTRQPNLVSFAVMDNGVGIPEREQKKIFRRFYQVDRRLARNTGGVGLGLSIVEFIVKAHGGAVVVNSRPGSGSTFTVSLPPSASAAGAVA